MNTKFEYAVSVVVPVYNQIDWIRNCLNSLVAQTMPLTDFEVLMINDGSTDGSEVICQEYADIFPNFRLVSKENEGLSATRNTAHKLARGQYIAYLDADDTFSPETLQNTVAFFKEHNDEIDLVAFPIVRYKDGGTLPLHFRYKFLEETGVYDLNEYPFALQANICILVKNRGEYTPDFSTAPDFRHEDQAFNNDVIAPRLKYGFVKEAEYRYNRDNDSSIIATYMYPLYIFESTTAYWEKLFAQYEEQVPQYFQAQFINDLSWKFAENRLWPTHYSSDELLEAKNRIYALLDRVDPKIIIDFPAMDFYQKSYWLRQKKNCIVDSFVDRDSHGMIADGKVYWKRKNMEVILRRIRIANGAVKVVGFFKSPLFSVAGAPSFYVDINGKRVELDVHVASASYYRAKEQTDRFYGFEFEHALSTFTRSERIRFGIELDGYDIPTVWWNSSGTAFYRGHFKDYVVDDIAVRQTGQAGLEFRRVSPSEQASIAAAIDQRFEDKTDLRVIRRMAQAKTERPIWLYYDNFTVEYDNGYLQFAHDFGTNDGVDRYYVVDGSLEERVHLFTEDQLPFVVQWGSQEHKRLYLQADKILSSFIEHFTISPFDSDDDQWIQDLANAELVYLQHGVMHAHIPWFYSPIGINVDKVVISSFFEYENMTQNLGFKSSSLLKTGMARYTEIDKNAPSRGRVLFAPSWRSYLISEPDDEGRRTGSAEKLLASSYMLGILEFAQSPELYELLERNDLHLDLKLHPNFFRVFGDAVDISNDRVHTCPNRVKVTDYDVFMTDFSSYVFDYAYLERPIIYFLPDRDEFFGGLNRYSQLDLPYSEAFGPLVTDAQEAIHALKKICDDSFVPEEVYSRRMSEFYFPMKDPCGALLQELQK